MISRIWRLNYGPCWCQGSAADTDSFEFMRKSVTAPSDRPGVNLLIVSDRVLDGSAVAFIETEREVPTPRLVVSTSACPATGAFWDALPVGWTDVGEILDVDARIDDCVNGHPQTLLLEVLDLLFEPGLVGVGTGTGLGLTDPELQPARTT